VKESSNKYKKRKKVKIIQTNLNKLLFFLIHSTTFMNQSQIDGKLSNRAIFYHYGFVADPDPGSGAFLPPRIRIRRQHL
jgi:hypothetical protein